jgi:hypothetical protein
MVSVVKLSFVMLNCIMLSVGKLSLIMLSLIMVSVIKLSVVMLSVIKPSVIILSVRGMHLFETPACFSKMPDSIGKIKIFSKSRINAIKLFSGRLSIFCHTKLGRFILAKHFTLILSV